MKKILFLVLFCLCKVACAQAQQSDPEKLQAAIDAERFVFEARQASGLRGQLVQIDPGYTLVVTPEKIAGDLPFFGRSFQGTIGSGSGGLQFEFSEFDFLVKPRKKGGYEITIRPTSPGEVRSLYLTVQKAGSASLRVLSNTRENMSYNGYIKD